MSEYFNLITTADFAYVNRVRQVSPGKGKPYWCATLACLEGKADQPGKVYIDVVLPDQFAARLAPFANTETTVKASVVRIGYREPRLYQKEGETRVSLKGALVGAYRIWTDEAVVYHKPRSVETSADDADSNASVASAPTDGVETGAAATTADTSRPPPPEVVEGLVFRQGRWVPVENQGASTA